MYRAAICDDNPADITYLNTMLKKWADDTGTAIQIESFSSSEAFLFQYEDNKAYDILFLDIEMGEMSGMELAKKYVKKTALFRLFLSQDIWNISRKAMT